MSKIEKQYWDHRNGYIYIVDVLVRIINAYIHIPVVLFNQQLALNLCDFDYIHVTFTLGQSNHVHCTA